MNRTALVVCSLVTTLVATSLGGCAPQASSAAPERGAHALVGFAVEGGGHHERSIERPARAERPAEKLTARSSR